jgi:hypothetical protein
MEGEKPGCSTSSEPCKERSCQCKGKGEGVVCLGGYSFDCRVDEK